MPSSEGSEKSGAVGPALAPEAAPPEVLVAPPHEAAHKDKQAAARAHVNALRSPCVMSYRPFITFSYANQAAVSGAPAMTRVISIVRVLMMMFVGKNPPINRASSCDPGSIVET